MTDLRNDIFRQSTVSLDEMEQMRANEMGSLRRGWETGRIGSERNALGIDSAAARAAGDAARADELQAENAALAQRQAMYTPEVQRVEDIHDVGSGLSWAAGQMGQGAASTVEPIAAATALGAVGRVAGMLPGAAGKIGRAVGTIGAPAAAYGINQRQLAGEFVNTAAEDNELMARTSPQELYETANIVGGVGGVLDTALPSIIGHQLTGGALRQGMKAAGGGMGAVPKLMLGMGLEGGTEYGQAKISQFARGELNPNRNTSGDASEDLNSLLGGAVGSGPMVGAGVAADAAYGRLGAGIRQTGDALETVKGKTGEVIDMVADHIPEGAKGWAKEKKDGAVEKFNDAIGRGKEIIDLARDDDGKVDLGRVVDAAEQEATERARKFVEGRGGPQFDLAPETLQAIAIKDDDMPEELLNSNDVDAQNTWYKDKDMKRALAVHSVLADIAETDPKAAELLPRIEDMDFSAIDEAAQYILDKSDRQKLETKAELAHGVWSTVGSVAAEGVTKVGGALGRMAVRGLRGAKNAGEALYEGAKQELDKKQNAQAFEESGDPSYDAWRARRDEWKVPPDSTAVRIQSDGKEEQRAERGRRSSFVGPQEPPLATDPAAAERSYRRAKLFSEILTAQLHDRDASVRRGQANGVEVPDSNPTLLTRASRTTPEALTGYMERMGYELNDIAESWGMAGEQSTNQPTKEAGQRQLGPLTLRLDSIADDMSAAYGNGALDLVDQMRWLAYPGSDPIFDHLRSRIETARTPQGRKERQQVRDNVANQLMQLVPVEQLKMLGSGGAYRHKLLKAIETISTTDHGEMREEFVKAFGGGKKGESTLMSMIGLVNGTMREPTRYAEAPMFGDSPNYNGATETSLDSDEVMGEDLLEGDESTGEETNDFDRRAAEKSTTRGTAPRVYAFAGTPNLRGGDQRFDPFEPIERLSGKEKEAREVENARRIEQGLEPIPADENTHRPRLVTETDKLFNEDNALEARVAGMEQQLKVDRTPERMAAIMEKEGNKAGAAKVRELIARGDEKAETILDDAVKSFFVNRAGEYLVQARSALNVMKDHGYQPGKILTAYRDYLTKDGNTEKAHEVRKALMHLTRKRDNTNTKDARYLALDDSRVEELLGEAKNYFGERYLVVADQLSSSTPNKLSLGEFVSLQRDGTRAMKGIFLGTRQKADEKAAEQGSLLTKAQKAQIQNELVAQNNILHFTGEDGKPVHIRAGILASWARIQHETYEGDYKDPEQTGEKYSDADKNQQYLKYLSDGISTILESGHVKSVWPYVKGKFGKNEQFGDPKFPGGIPPSLQLSTTSEYSRQEKRAGKVAGIKTAEKIFGPPHPKLQGDASKDELYQAKVIGDMLQGDEDPEPVARRTMNKTEQAAYDSLGTVEGRMKALDLPSSILNPSQQAWVEKLKSRGEKKVYIEKYAKKTAEAISYYHKMTPEEARKLYRRQIALPVPGVSFSDMGETRRRTYATDGSEGSPDAVMDTNRRMTAAEVNAYTQLDHVTGRRENIGPPMDTASLNHYGKLKEYSALKTPQDRMKFKEEFRNSPVLDDYYENMSPVEARRVYLLQIGIEPGDPDLAKTVGNWVDPKSLLEVQKQKYDKLLREKGLDAAEEYLSEITDENSSKTPLDFKENKDPGGAPGAFKDQLYRTKQGGKSAYDPLPFESKMDAVKKAKERSGPILRDLLGGLVEGDDQQSILKAEEARQMGINQLLRRIKAGAMTFSEGKEQAKAADQALREASGKVRAAAEAVREGRGSKAALEEAKKERDAARDAANYAASASKVVGGIQYLYPAAQLLSPDSIDAIASMKGTPETMHADLRKLRMQAVRALQKTDASAMHKVNLLKLMAPPEGRGLINDKNIDYRIAQILAKETDTKDIKFDMPGLDLYPERQNPEMRDISRKPLKPLVREDGRTTGPREVGSEPRFPGELTRTPSKYVDKDGTIRTVSKALVDRHTSHQMMRSVSIRDTLDKLIAQARQLAPAPAPVAAPVKRAADNVQVAPSAATPKVVASFSADELNAVWDEIIAKSRVLSFPPKGHTPADTRAIYAWANAQLSAMQGAVKQAETTGVAVADGMAHAMNDLEDLVEQAERKVDHNTDPADMDMEQRIRSEKYDGLLDTVADVDKFLTGAYALWQKGAKNPRTQEMLNDMFATKGWASTDLGSFYDGVEDGGEDYEPPRHSQILAKLKNAALEGVAEAPKSQPKPGGVKLTARSPYVGKDQSKADRANKFIGRGSPRSSTAQYAKDFGDRANTGSYTAADTVFVSAEGNRAGRVDPDFTELGKAAQAGATFITDGRADRGREYNVGERQVAEFLTKQGYTEVAPGEWKSAQALPSRLLGQQEMRRLLRSSPNQSELIRAVNKTIGIAEGVRLLGITRKEVFDRHDVSRSMEPILTGILTGDQGAITARDLLINAVDQVYAQPYDGELNVTIFRMLRDPKGHVLRDYMDAIGRSKLPESTKAIARAVGKVAGNTPVSAMEKQYVGQAEGLFLSDKGTIQVDPAGHGRAGSTLHEGIHAASVRALDADTELRQAVADLIDHITEYDPKLLAAYGMSNSLEFVAEAMSNIELQRKLFKIPPSTKVSEYLGRTLANAWEAFVQLVRKALKLPNEHTSALAQAIELSGRAMKATGQSGKVTTVASIRKSTGLRVQANQDTMRDAYREVRSSPAWAEQVTAAERVGAINSMVMPEGHTAIPHFGAVSLAEMRGVMRDAAPGSVKSIAEFERLVLDQLTHLGATESHRMLPNRVKLNQQSFDFDAPHMDPAKEREIRAYVNKVLGPKIKVAFSDTMKHSAEWDPTDLAITISTTAASGLDSAAHHEALHAFFGLYAKNDPKVLGVMSSLTDDPKILARLQALLHKFPAAQAQLVDGEERLAYLYQFWAAGLLDLGPGKGRTWLQKLRKFFRQVLGLVQDSERAVDILEAFHAGKMRDPSTAAKVLNSLASDKAWSVKARRNMDGLLQQVGRAILPAQDILKNSPSARARRLLEDFYASPGDEAGGSKGEGYLNARKAGSIRRKNALAKAIEGLSERDMRDVTTALQRGVKPTDVDSLPYAPVRAAVGAIRAELDDFHEYMTGKGLKIGRVEDYFPVVWDTAKLEANGEEFMSMLQRNYPERVGNREEAEKLLAGLVNRAIEDGRVDPERDDGVITPLFESVEERKLSWIAPEHRTPFLKEGLIPTLTKYFEHGVRRAEYTARFGERGERLDSALDRIKEELAEAAQVKLTNGEFKKREDADKWALRQFRDIDQSVGAMLGTLGKEISDGHRAASSWATVYQNVRLLPLALFASVVDPMSIAARSGDFKLAAETFMKGMQGVFRNWKEMISGMPSEHQKTEWEEMAEFVGTTEAAIFAHHVSDEYASEYMSARARKINEFMFKANGMEAWNREMRVGATKGAVQFIQRHARGIKEKHSERWLKELGLTAEDVIMDSNGKLLVSRQEIALKTGFPPEKAQQLETKIRFAINRWVEGAVITPNSAQRPAWASDPRWAFIFHLKQFTYSFHQTILTRAWNELKHGNLAPMGALAWAIPVMIGADIVKSLLTNGGELPAHMKGYDVADWVKHGVDRVGLLGYGQIGADAVEDPASLAGPMAEQIVDAFRQPLNETLVEAMPLQPLYRRALL